MKPVMTDASGIAKVFGPSSVCHVVLVTSEKLSNTAISVTSSKYPSSNSSRDVSKGRAVMRSQAVRVTRCNIDESEGAKNNYKTGMLG